MAIFIFLALVVVASAMAMLLSRNAVYAALFLAMNFVTVALLYLILGAPFIALVQVTVYAGSIMVLFLFVIMMLGAERLPGGEPLRGQRVLAILLGCVLLVEMGLIFALRSGLLQIQMPAVVFSEPVDLGELLFTRYQLLFLVTSVILLAATVGAILLTRGDKVSLRDLLQRKE
ncbi:MAG: NADH-quinone oxidoreductase subunit J [Anaerolineae bacterium]|nr:NADH-quinone oxidoreductase subunit J [Anaerolineae bacterium]